MRILGGYSREKASSKSSNVTGSVSVRQTRAEKSAEPDFAARSSYRIGRTIAGDAKKTLEAKRRRANDQRKRKMRYTAVISAACLIALGALFVGIRITLKQKAERELAELEAQNIQVKEPTVPIIDENVGENISQRVKDFVYDLEGDLAIEGIAIDHVSLPLQKARELRVFIGGRAEYYKMSLDRGSAVQAEDLARMVKYLNDNDIHPEYVDLRVSGKAYYK